MSKVFVKNKISKKLKKYYCTGGSKIKPVKHGDICVYENNKKDKGSIKMGKADNNIVPLICKKSLKHLTKENKKRKSTLSSNKQKSCYDKYCWHRLSAKNKLFKRNKYKEVLKDIKKSKKKNINQNLPTKPPKPSPKPPPKPPPKAPKPPKPPKPPRSNSNQMPKNNKTNSKKDNSFKLISWNVYFKLLSTDPMRLDNIKMYLSEPDIKPDILFTQESHFDLPEPTFSNYTHIFFSSPRKSAISIHFNNDKFNLISDIVKLGLSDIEVNGKIREIEFKVDKNINDNTGSSYRPILAVKLKHITSKKNIIFVNLWVPHHINQKGTGNMAIFFACLNKVIDSLYDNGDRIIMAGDFNEFYENSSREFNVDTIDLKCGIRLHLKQKENTCCGSTTISRTGGLFRDIKESRPFDLLYDSDFNGSNVEIGDNRMSDHLPILSTIKI